MVLDVNEGRVLSPEKYERFAERIVAWQRSHGRHDLPWQVRRDPYAIWVSEIMLQQTQVATVVPYYLRFMQRFPDVGTLALAPLDEVMQLWSGLGYYSRARNLHRAAMTVAARYAGTLPQGADELASLPGIGRSTAAAIAALAFDRRCAILDGNVKRVLCRYFAITGDAGSGALERELWTLAEDLVPAEAAAVYTQGMMDLGATVCTRRTPQCERCPLAADCIAYRTGRVDDLPQARRRSPQRERAVAMLLLRHRQRIMLEKRPAHGIWGGLWSLPEADADGRPDTFWACQFGLDIVQATPLPVVHHAFTHFRLRIEPWRVELQSLRHFAGEANHAWFGLAAARAAALPAPIRRILEGE
jgi:A/G-specific adenine glycosylase